VNENENPFPHNRTVTGSAISDVANTTEAIDYYFSVHVILHKLCVIKINLFIFEISLKTNSRSRLGRDEIWTVDCQVSH